ncbi:hypothetical protein AcW1_008063 [Taiwanofungus camphoratus]|nr:hypothetical protein AcV5_008360 [Antrodia cinnamomea]KAI0950872.1 hypothetical protein AcW1_008063 [Antrodia cinnamomea]
MSQHSTSKIAAGVIAAITLTIALMYIGGFYYLYIYSKKHPKALNKAVGVRLQRYVPVVYIFLIISSIIEIATSSWLLVVYNGIHNYPNVGARNGIRLCLFSACWTLLFSTLYIVLFAHPTLSKHPLASIGSQAIWVLASWCFWVACTATLSGALPFATSGACLGLPYCGQLQALFAFSVIEMLVMTLSMLGLVWLIWRYVRDSKSVILPR